MGDLGDEHSRHRVQHVQGRKSMNFPVRSSQEVGVAYTWEQGERGVGVASREQEDQDTG